MSGAHGVASLTSAAIPRDAHPSISTEREAYLQQTRYPGPAQYYNAEEWLDGNRQAHVLYGRSVPVGQTPKIGLLPGKPGHNQTPDYVNELEKATTMDSYSASTQESGSTPIDTDSSTAADDSYYGKSTVVSEGGQPGLKGEVISGSTTPTPVDRHMSASDPEHSAISSSSVADEQGRPESTAQSGSQRIQSPSDAWVAEIGGSALGSLKGPAQSWPNQS